MTADSPLVRIADTLAHIDYPVYGYEDLTPRAQEKYRDRARTIVNALKHETVVDRMAEAMATEGDEEDCFQVIREYQALSTAEKKDYNHAHGFPVLAMESCNHWRKKARAALAALA